MSKDSLMGKSDIQDIKLQVNEPKDPFEVKHGYNYDYVFVFKVHDETEELTQIQKDLSMRTVLQRLANAGLETKMYYSTSRDLVFCKIRASLERLCKEADRIDLKLEFDSDELKRVAEAGYPDRGIAPIRIKDDPTLTHRKAFDNIFAKYDMEPRLQPVYKKYGHKKIPFRGVDRIKLILSIVGSSTTDGGCHLNVTTLTIKKCLVTAYALHDEEEQASLTKKWINWASLPWQQPYTEIKDYYGEKVGLYFVWLGHYTTWLIGPSVVGIAMLVNIVMEHTPDARLISVFGLFMALWGTVYLESWKRRNSVIKLEWGMDGFEEEEGDRAEFDGVEVESPVDGRPMRYFSAKKKTSRVCASLVFIFVLILMVLAAVAAIFVFRYFARPGKALESFVTISGVNLSVPIGATLNAVQIQVMNGIYGTIAVRLNNFENHRTETEYEDNLIAKTFLFQFVNSYASLFYIAFIKNAIPDNACTDVAKGGCLFDLMFSLGIIFGLRLTSGNFFEAVLPYIKRKLAARFRKPDTSEDGVQRHVSAAEEQMHLGAYDNMGIFADYNEMIIQFGYITLFVVSFPLAPFLALLNNYFEIRIDAFKLAKESRRPNPHGAEDIGTWQTILEIMGTISVVTNVAAVVFVSNHTFSGMSFESKLWTFIAVEHVILLFKYVLSVVIDDVPEDVKLQLDRSKFLNDKVVHLIQDDDDADLVKGNKLKVDLTIFDEDV
ncbi:hypothetical protein DYB37_006836 [Aphanomyces astaci]|uniref:Uncharacterized protein n=1 Tax=Aphanomyces astaci TaxID=112090 RepID=A0A3R6XLC4_APHAT|nr:hypothetical protein DYB35_001967 [Aphanomyces astaci]RHZ04006.1 hypothetical protein DYB37_006836 [Aphanomyces astaci]